MRIASSGSERDTGGVTLTEGVYAATANITLISYPMKYQMKFQLWNA